MIHAKYDETSLYFADIEELTSSTFYDTFTYIDMSGMNLSKAPSIWPSAMQILKCEKNRLDALENLPATLRMLYARINKLELFPVVSHCTDLELIDVYDNNIWSLDTAIPDSVHAIDISFNKLREISYDLVPHHVKITASFCFLTTVPPPPFADTMIYDHNDVAYVRTGAMAGARARARARTTVTEGFENRIVAKKHTETIVYNDAQNVHISSVQHSANVSLDVILKYKAKNKNKYDNTESIIQEVSYAFNRYQRKKKKLYWFLPGLFLPKLPLELWCADKTIHSIHGISYKTLLQHVWRIIQDHEDRNELEMILCEELDTSRSVCFTGRFTRTLNTLSGFVEGVKVGISSAEQMQNHISKAIETCREKYKDPEEFMMHAKETVGGILDEFGVVDAEREAWLDAIE